MPGILALLSAATSPVDGAQSGQGVPGVAGAAEISRARGDFDEDGLPDLLTGSAGGRGGVLSLWIAGGDPASTKRRVSFATPVPPLLLAAGDFDADGHLDAAFASPGGRQIDWMAGDGRGGLSLRTPVPLPGPILALASGEINRPDGLVDLVLSVGGGGPLVAVFESPRGALSDTPEFIPVPEECASLELKNAPGPRSGSSGIESPADGLMDLWMSGGCEPRVLTGRDRKLSTRMPWSRGPGPAALRRVAPGDSAAPAPNATAPVANGPAAPAAILIVASPGDSTDATPGDGACDDGLGACTLRAAIEEANALGGVDTIQFAIGTGFAHIVPGSPLPPLTEAVAIDGTTQPGFTGAPLIEIDGTLAGGGADGLEIAAEDCSVAGLVINRFSGSGIRIGPAGSGARVSACYIGTDVSGTGPQANGGNGIFLDGASSATIGGTTSQFRNLISGNSQSGVLIQGQGATGNSITGNFIGVDVGGSAAVMNQLDGVRILDASGNSIGGTAAGAKNVISGNNLSGVQLGQGATLNLVQGNFIGTDAAGAAPVGNLNGILVNGGAGNMLGGTVGTARNVLSGNIKHGVQLASIGSTGNLVQGNRIGTRADGAAPLANNSSGVAIVGTDAFDSPVNDAIGGTVAGAGNTIASNGGDGVQVGGEAAGQMILANSVFGNARQGIDLGADGPTPDDAGDADSGPNRLQNFPELKAADIGSGGNLVLSFHVDSDPANAAYPLLVEFFRTDATGGQGQAWLGSATFTPADFLAGQSGAFASADLGDSTMLGQGADLTVTSGDRIVATATDGLANQGGPMNSSEFSANIPVNHAPDAADDDARTQAGAPVTLDVLVNDTDADGSLDFDTLGVTVPPANGSVVVESDGTNLTGEVTYTPDAGFIGTDTFRYTVSDDDGAASGQALVTIDVVTNEPPSAAADSATAKIDTPVTISVLSNDTDPDGTIDVTTVAITSVPASGTAVPASDGTVTYTPGTGFTGTDSFEYTVADDLGGISDPALVTITVNPNQAPVARNDSVSSKVNTAVKISVLANDSDADGSLSAASVQVTAPPQNGTAVPAPDGTVTYTPSPGFEGDDSFDYTVNDDDGLTSPAATVSIRVNKLNGSPVAVDDLVKTEVNTPMAFAVLPNDTDPDGTSDILSVTTVSDPPHGAAAINSDQTVAYAPDPGFTGGDFFLYTVSDGNGGVDTGRVDVVVVRGPDLTGTWIGIAQDCNPGKKRCPIRGTFSVLNRGQEKSGGIRVEFFLSADGLPDPGDLLVQRRETGSLGAGRNRAIALKYKPLPGVDLSGLQVIAVIDPRDRIAENYESNNVVASGVIP